MIDYSKYKKINKTIKLANINKDFFEPPSFFRYEDAISGSYSIINNIHNLKIGSYFLYQICYNVVNSISCVKIGKVNKIDYADNLKYVHFREDFRTKKIKEYDDLDIRLDEKYYINFITEKTSDFLIFKTWNDKPSLSEIREAYKKTYSDYGNHERVNKINKIFNI